MRLAEPALDWVHIEGFTELGDIPPNGNANFVLRFEPPLTLANTSYALNPLLEVYSDNASTVPINAGIVITSSERGGLALRIINADKERDANGQGSPVADAKVTLTSLDISGMVMKVSGDANGLVEFRDIPAGKYQWTAEAPGFQPRSDTVTIEPGLTKTLEAILPTATVTYEWSVSPTKIVDRYDVTLSLTLRTDVLAPALVMDPMIINLAQGHGQTTFAQYTITNMGLVSAFDVNIAFQGDDGISVELPFRSIPEIKPHQTVVVPMKVTTHSLPCNFGTLHHSCGYFCAAGTKLSSEQPSVLLSAGEKCKDESSAEGGEVGGREAGGGGGIFQAIKQWISSFLGLSAEVSSCGNDDDDMCDRVRQLYTKPPAGATTKKTECLYVCRSDGYNFYDYVLAPVDGPYRDCVTPVKDPRPK